MSETALPKRPPKARVVQFSISLYDLLQGGHIDQATVSAQLKNSGMYLYTGEIEKIIENELKSNSGFNGEAFTDMLLEAAILVEGAAPVFGGGGARINSIERATEVANDSANAGLIVELITEAIAIKKKVNELVGDNATLSYALKNKKKAGKNEAEAVTDDAPSAEDME